MSFSCPSGDVQPGTGGSSGYIDAVICKLGSDGWLSSVSDWSYHDYTDANNGAYDHCDSDSNWGGCRLSNIQTCKYEPCAQRFKELMSWYSIGTPTWITESGRTGLNRRYPYNDCPSGYDHTSCADASGGCGNVLRRVLRQ
jgi:hypothetical protein